MATHIRQRSSMSRVMQPLPLPPRGSDESSLFSRSTYDVRSGDVTLPPSPPLITWDPDSARSSPVEEKKPAPRLLSTTLAQNAPLIWRSPPEGKGGGRTARWPISTVLLVAASLCFVVVVFCALPSAPLRESTTFVSRLHTSSPKQACNPYAADGDLQVDFADPDRNRWQPRDPNCAAPPNLFARLRFLNERYQRETIAPTEFDWLRGKTVLLIGDSVSREHIENFCQLMGEDAEVIRPSHKWAPAPSRQRASSRLVLQDGRRGSRLSPRSGNAFRDAGRPRMCYIPHFDFLLLSVLHYGFSQDEHWALSQHPQYTAPGNLEHRIADVIRPLLANIRADGRPTAPDYIEFAPGTWDLARWAEQDVAAQRDSNEPLSPERLTWFRHRLTAVANRIQAAFPSAATKVYRTMYFPLDQDAEIDYFSDKTTSRSSSSNASTSGAPYFAHERVEQINSVIHSKAHHGSAESASSDMVYEAPGSGFRVSEFGNILKGYPPHQTDRLHGEPVPGGYLHANMLLYELQQAHAR
ncbi:hypothetical protein JCM10908_006054 [Rhodotorula pacifica]|uniref:uncharacterized protein n=1 Tax=Rhodotorula pacifica TaxID=1495444 RepID=UPI00316B0B96